MEAADLAILAQIDWTQPWYAPYAQIGTRLSQRLAQDSSVRQALNAEAQAQNHPMRFVPQAALPSGVAYESFIYIQRQVPTRENAHDFFNGLIWLHFPCTKARLNRLQEEAIKASGGVGAQRGPLRDALTLFDENAALLWGPSSADLHQLLQNRAWTQALVEQRPVWQQQAFLLLFGHALLEKLLKPYPSITAHVWRFDHSGSIPNPYTASYAAANTAQNVTLNATINARPTLDWDSELDSALSQSLDADLIARKPFAPLPVLGLPHWCAENQ